ncbi:MAG: sensor histidine kinase [Lachnospiraceae bacterium]
MKERLADKMFILVAYVCGLLLLCGSEVNNMFIAAFLLAIIELVLLELYPNDTAVFCTAVFSMLLCGYSSAFCLLLPMNVYAIFFTPWFCWKMKEYRNAWLSRKDSTVTFRSFGENKKYEIESESLTDKQRILRNIGILLLLLLMCLLGMTGFFVYYRNQNETAANLFVLVMVVTIFLALKTEGMQIHMRQVRERYDVARLEAGRAKRERKVAMEREEEHIYMATLRERNRIAREIHDNVGHMLTRTIVQLQAIRIINKDDNIKPYLESVDETVNQTMLNIRKSVHELHNDSIDLSVMLNELLKAIPDSFQVDCNTSIESAMNSDFKNNILAIIKEAITNISKYSNGDRVKVEVIEHAAFWRIFIWDNGKNQKKDFVEQMHSRNFSGGIGLENIYERAKNIGGRTNITSDEKGFSILITVPK